MDTDKVLSIYNYRNILSVIFYGMENLAFIIDIHGKILTINAAAIKRFRKKKKDLNGKYLEEVFDTKSSSGIQGAYIEVVRQTKEPVFYQYNLKGKIFQVSLFPIKNKTNSCIELFLLKMNDITESTQNENLLYRYKQIINAVDYPVSFVDDNLIYQTINDAFLLLYKKPLEKVIGSTIIDVVGNEVYKKIRKSLDSCKEGDNITFHNWISYSDGIKRFMEIKFFPVLSKNHLVSGIIISEIDVTHRKLIEEQLKELSISDKLTGIFNRAKFEESINQEIERQKRYSSHFSLIMFDIDNFKKVNDVYGHAVGDKVLIEIVNLVKQNIREVDLFSRWGGDEFIILLPHTRIENAVILGEKIRIKIEDHHFSGVGKMTCSFGVSDFKVDDKKELFLKKVDQALYEAKKIGGNRVISK